MGFEIISTCQMTKSTNAVYTLESTVFLNVDKIKYVGVTITEDMRWHTHVSNICSKANRALDYLRYGTCILVSKS